MEDTHAGGLAGILEEAFRLSSAGHLGDSARARLWALAAEGAIAGETAHALVEIDIQARGRAGRASKGAGAAKAQRREEVRLAWARAVPWAIRGRIGLPLATLAVFGMLIARAGERRGEWRAELSFTEMQRRLGGASRDTVAGAVARLERHGFIRAIRRRRNPRFSEVNVYVLEHPQAACAAAREPWRGEEEAQEGGADTGSPSGAASGGPESAPGAPSPSERLRASQGTVGEAASPAPWNASASNSPPHWTHKNPKKDSTTKLQVHALPRHNHFSKPSSARPTTTNQPSCSRLQGSKRRGLAPPRPPETHRVEPIPLTETTARNLARQAALELWASEGEGRDHWRIAEQLLEAEFADFDRGAWATAQLRHGARAALAVIETALVARIRQSTEDPIRSAPAYLGGILRRKPQDCRPEITLQRLAQARTAALARTTAAGRNDAVSIASNAPEVASWP